ncbi:MAG: DUF6646 family protein [Maribacter sp.]
MKSGLSFLCIILFSVQLSAQQSYFGEGDQKFQIGASFQENGTGIVSSYDLGIGENISIGLQGAYILGVNTDINADFGDRFDIKGRFNANLGNVLKIDERFDVYPGLHLGLKNFGAHLGTRFFFSDGFGLFAEASLPIAKYNNDELTPAKELNNQFIFAIGASFNL